MDPEKPTVAEEVRLKRLLQFSNLLAGGAASTAARSSASSSSSTRATVGPSAAAGSAAPTVHRGYTLGASSSVGSSSAPPVAPFAGGSTLGASSSAGLSLSPPVPTSGGYTLGTLSAGPSSAPPVPTSSRGYTHGASVSSSAPRDVLSSGSASVINPRSSCPVEGSSGAAVMFLNGSDSADLSKILQRLLQSAAAIRSGLDACSTQQLPRRQPLQELNPGRSKAGNNTQLVDSYSSEEDDPNRQRQISAFNRRRMQLLKNNKWREQLPSTFSQGFGDENSSPTKSSPPKKRGPGRPKGSKNKATKQRSSKAESEKDVYCHECDGEAEGRRVLLSCGHLFHVHCLNRTQAEKKLEGHEGNLCPFCGVEYTKKIPYFG